MFGFEYGGLFGLIVLILDVWAIVTIVQGRGSTAQKVIWIVIILLLPILGFLIWFLFGRK